MKLIKVIATAAVVAIPMMLASTAAVADGAALYKKCAACHGSTGMGTMGPRLAGQQEKYLIEQTKLIRDGKRTSGKSGMMKGAVSKTSDADIAAISKYLAGLK